MVYCIEIQQLILNSDSCMTCKAFYVQFTKYQPTCQHNLLHVVRQFDLKHGTLDHAIEHGRSRAANCHWLSNIKVLFI